MWQEPGSTGAHALVAAVLALPPSIVAGTVAAVFAWRRGLPRSAAWLIAAGLAVLFAGIFTGRYWFKLDYLPWEDGVKDVDLLEGHPSSTLYSSEAVQTAMETVGLTLIVLAVWSGRGAERTEPSDPADAAPSPGVD